MNRTRYVLRDQARIRERAESRIARDMLAERPSNTGLPPYEQPRDSIYYNQITRLYHLTDKDGWTVQQFTLRSDAESYRDRNRQRDGTYPVRANPTR